MRDPKTHERALHAALQVARGARKQQAAAAVTGIVMLSGCSSDGGPETTSPEDTTASDTVNGNASDNDTQALIDAMDAAAAQDDAQVAAPDITAAPQPDAEATSDADPVTQTDTMVATDTTTPTTDTMAATDATTSASDVEGTEAQDTEASAGDTAASADAAVECIDNCWQPNGVACTEHMDCSTEEVMGTCANTSEPCNYGAQQCPGDIACEGYQPAMEPYLDSETGDLPEYASILGCFDGICHEGDAISQAAQQCCGFNPDEDALPWCEGVDYKPGCTPWGPPAPPSHDGTTLAQRMQRWLS